MSETYCGKNCGDCSCREQIACPGCMAGPGKQFSGDCELAQCCRSKGHKTCGTCGFQDSCITLRCRDNMADYRHKKREAEAAQHARITRRATVLGKWLWILFWLLIPNLSIGLIANSTIYQRIPVMYMPGQIMRAIPSIVYGLILLKLSSESHHYRNSGICCLISLGINVWAALLLGDEFETAWAVLLSLPATIVGLIGEYQEYAAHSAVLAGVDTILSDNWLILWKWYVGILGVTLGIPILLLMAPPLGTLVLLATDIGIIVLTVLKYVYLYRTATIFRAYTAKDV